MSGKERRIHHRYKLWVPTRIEGADAPRSRLAVGHDMSQTGSLMVTSDERKVGEQIKLFIRVPPDSEEEQVICARVIRCEVNDADPNGLWPYRIAVAFEQAEPEFEELLRSHSQMLTGLTDAGEQAG